MSLYDAKTPEEIAAALKAEYPDRIEFEPGKFAEYNEDRACWIYHDPAGAEVVIQI